MSDSKHKRWLLGELPALVSAGVLDNDAARRLREHYQSAANGQSLGMVLLGILGAALIGFGIILLFAHNWAQWTREMRTLMSFVPLLAGQVAVAWTLLRRRESALWREASGVFLTLAIGASIALVEQTYHYGSGDPASFLMVWSLLALPLIYLLDSSAVALLYWAGLCGWALCAQKWRPDAVWFWPLLVVSLPHVWRHLRSDTAGLRSAWLLWGLGISLVYGLLVAFDYLWWGWRLLVTSSLFAAALLASNRWLAPLPGKGNRPARQFGVLGIATISLLLAFETPQLWLHYHYQSWQWNELAASAAVLWLLMLLYAVLWAQAWRQRDPLELLWGASPLVVLAVCWLVQPGVYAAGAEGAMLVANVYVFVLSVMTLRSGMHRTNMARLNGGMGMLCLLILIRFFDSDLPFLLRGIVFVLIGAAFLFANWRLRRRMLA